MDTITQQQFQNFLLIRHRNYRLVNLEMTNVKSDIRYYADDPQRLSTLTQRLAELHVIKSKQRYLQKQFVPRYFTIKDDVPIQLKNRSEAYKIIDEANGYDVDSGEPLWKLCKDCGEEKPVIEYYNHATTKDGLMSKCKVCSQQTAYDTRHDKKKRLNERQEIEDYINTG